MNRSHHPEGERLSTPVRSRWGAGALLAALICAVLAGSSFDSTASAQSPHIENLSPPTITGSATVTVVANSTAVATYRAQDPDGAGL